MPSRFSPAGTLNGVNVSQSILSQTTRPTPSTTPFPQAYAGADTGNGMTTPTSNNSTLLSRLRAGSMPQRPGYMAPNNPFGPSVFSTNWASSRDRATTLSSIRSSDAPDSPSSFSREGLTEGDVRTLDYLGLAETPQQARASLVNPTVEMLLAQQQQNSTIPMLAELAMLKNNNRYRSYSVNAKEKYADEEEEDYGHFPGVPNGVLTPSAAAAAAQLAATQAQIHQHNLAVQAFANHASANRPRARTAGILDAAPQRTSLRNYLATPSRLNDSVTAADLGILEDNVYNELSDAVQMMQVNNLATAARPEAVDNNDLEGPTRALWIGSIPVSTTVTSLDAIFSMYGPIESTRVLTHKNCGFVNFDRVESAIQAKSLLNGKEIFPGAGPIRIGYAKVPTASTSGTPGPNGIQPSPTPDPNSRKAASAGENGQVEGQISASHAPPAVAELPELKTEMIQIVTEFGATEEEATTVSDCIDSAIRYQRFEKEIPPVPEASQTRMHDAPRLRDIRKRIDNGACAAQEIEETANGMLPEIAELASDYLGNTVVQKLFEFCSEQTKEQMLEQICPHLAQIGVHKNGTWAAQKIIDVAKTPAQMNMIVDALRPYTVPLFLDQYGNYVLQCCLRFGAPYNNFIFETMLSQMWEISQGRFGARAMRACLESHHATKDQQRMVASAIALHSVQLATSANGALLLTWFLDTCTFPHRRTVLAPRLVPHLVHLCTHKVAYLTVLKVINQRNEPEAREIVLKALFFSPGDEVLESILKDQTSGATLIFKVLTTPFFDETMRSEVIKIVAKVLTRIKATPNQGYKRLMDEVGLSSRTGGRDSHSRDGARSTSRGGERRSMSQQGRSSSYTRQEQYNRREQYNPAQSQGFDDGRPGSADPVNQPAFDPYASNGQSFPAQNSILLGQQVAYPPFLPRNVSGGNNFFPQVPNGFSAYPTNGSPVDNFRPMPNHASPMAAQAQLQQNAVLGQAPFSTGQFPVMNNGAYGYPQAAQPQQYYGQRPQAVHQSNNRRTRVSQSAQTVR